MPAIPRTGHVTAYDRFVAILDGYILAAPDMGIDRLAEYPYRLDLEDIEESGCHRTFHVVYSGSQPFEGNGGTFAGNILDDQILLKVQVAYFVGGGGMLTGDRQEVDRLAADDLNRIRQILQHPVNYDSANTGIANVQWEGTTVAVDEIGSHKRVYELSFRVHVRHEVFS